MKKKQVERDRNTKREKGERKKETWELIFEHQIDKRSINNKSHNIDQQIDKISKKNKVKLNYKSNQLFYEIKMKKMIIILHIF